MAAVNDARDAVDIVRCEWYVGKPEWKNFRTRKQGYTWIVTFDEMFLDGIENHEVHINARTGDILRFD